MCTRIWVTLDHCSPQHSLSTQFRYRDLLSVCVLVSRLDSEFVTRAHLAVLGGGEEVGLGVRLHLLVAGHRALFVVVREHLGSSGPGARGHTHLGYSYIGIYIIFALCHVSFCISCR